MIGRSKFSTITEALPMTWVMTRRQNGILRSFLRRHLAGKTAVASRNVDCLLKLSSSKLAYLFDLKTEPFPHALNITILVKEKGIIGGWFYVKPETHKGLKRVTLTDIVVTFSELMQVVNELKCLL